MTEPAAIRSDHAELPAPESHGLARARLEHLKQASVAQLLFRAARLWNEQAIRQLQQHQPAARLAHTAVLPHIDWQGTRITDLAARMGVSKQAASQVVQEMVRLGLLELQPDPTDGRARRVCFSPQGMQAMSEGLQTLAEMQQSLSASFGPDRMAQLLDLLQDLIPLLETLPGTAETQSASAD